MTAPWCASSSGFTRAVCTTLSSAAGFLSPSPQRRCCWPPSAPCFGRAELDEHAEGVHSSEIEVDLHASRRSKSEIVADIRSRLAVLPLSINVGQPISHRLDHMLSGIRSEIAVKVFGDDLDAMLRKAEELREKMARIP